MVVKGRAIPFVVANKRSYGITAHRQNGSYGLKAVLVPITQNFCLQCYSWERNLKRVHGRS